MYKIGDKVETLYGVCLIENHDTKLKVFHTKHIKTQRLFMFYEDSLDILGLYRTAHEKLIEMGYEFTKRSDYVFYRHDDLPRITIYSDKTYSCSDTNLELSCILTRYLEEMEE